MISLTPNDFNVIFILAEGCTLLVQGMSNNKLELKLGVRGTALPLFLQRGINSVQDCKVRFVAADLPARMQFASTIDLLTAMQDRFVNATPTTSNDRVPLVINRFLLILLSFNDPQCTSNSFCPQQRLKMGLFLFFCMILQITDNQMQSLAQGVGFYNKGLDDEQQRAVVQLLSNANVHGLFLLLGPGGCGKTSVLIEATAQINHHHRERLPCDAAYVICLHQRSCILMSINVAESTSASRQTRIAGNW